MNTSGLEGSQRGDWERMRQRRGELDCGWGAGVPILMCRTEPGVEIEVGRAVGGAGSSAEVVRSAEV